MGCGEACKNFCRHLRIREEVALRRSDATLAKHVMALALAPEN